ncbi:IS66-like element accessory protein TnpA [Burkholderia latens]|uniref:IS66-like element accessory protein TnpA n=1 Tax=Burkholderia latens TaxID=488446 RepID=UPI00158B8DD9|nr:transposase [Burkholderia latens]
MSEKRDLRSRLVIGRKRDGRREYDDAARDELVQICLQPGVSIARTAMEHGLNPNLLRSWIARYQKIQAQLEHERVARTPAISDGVTIDLPNPPSAFVPIVAATASPCAQPSELSPLPSSMVLSLHVRLSNGVEFDLGEASIDELATVIQMLGRLPCSGSTKP